MKMKHLDQEQKNQLRDQISNFRLQEISAEGEHNQLKYDKENIPEAIDIKIKLCLKKIEVLRSNIKTLDNQLRNGIPVEEEVETEAETEKDSSEAPEPAEKPSEEESEAESEETEEE